MTKRTSQLEISFETAFCTERVKPGDSVTCGCGVTHKSTEENPLHAGEAPGGYMLVMGCECDFPASFGGMMWRYRHQVATFFRIVTDAMHRDREKLLGRLPEEIGETIVESLEGKTGTAGSNPCTCIEDNGNSLKLRFEGRVGVETCLRMAFKPDPKA